MPLNYVLKRFSRLLDFSDSRPQLVTLPGIEARAQLARLGNKELRQDTETLEATGTPTAIQSSSIRWGISEPEHMQQLTC